MSRGMHDDRRIPRPGELCHAFPRTRRTTPLQERFRHLRELTRIMEKEINAVILDRAHACRQMLRDVSAGPPTFH